MELRYCDLCGCKCYACAVGNAGCDDCELLYPDLFPDYEIPFTEALLDHFGL